MRVSDLNIDRIYINSQIRKPDYKMAENHFHYYYEIYYLRRGECQMYVSTHPFRLRGGDFVIIPPREVHVIQYLRDCERINLYFRASDLTENDQYLFPEHAGTLLRPGIIHIPDAWRFTVESVLDRMIQEETINDISTPKMMTLLFRQFLVDAGRYGIHRTIPDPVCNESNREILESVQYIREHYNEPLSLESLADHAGLSMTYFSRKFHQVTGMGMKEYLTYVRLSSAEKELLSTTHSIYEVAANCGFSNSNYFKDAFKKTYGMSPKTFRKSGIADLLSEENLLREGEEREPSASA